MGNFSRGSSRGGFGGRPGGFRSRPGGFGGRSEGGFRGRDSGRPIEHHNATCSKCGKACQVPFKPTGKKPILCSDCFRQSGNARDSPRGMSQSGVSPEQIKQINVKLDRILTILQDLEIDEGDDADEDEEEKEAEPETKAKPEMKAKSKVPSKDPAADTDDDDEDEEEEDTDEAEETDEEETKSEDIKE